MAAILVFECKKTMAPARKRRRWKKGCAAHKEKEREGKGCGGMCVRCNGHVALRGGGINHSRNRVKSPNVDVLALCSKTIHKTAMPTAPANPPIIIPSDVPLSM